MGTQTEWKIERETDATNDAYLADLAERGVLAEFEQNCDIIDTGGSIDEEDAADVLAKAREICK